MNEIIKLLKYEKENKIKNGLYGLTQRSIAYNSNKIEGSTLTEEDTLTLFNEGKLYNRENIYIAKHLVSKYKTVPHPIWTKDDIMEATIAASNRISKFVFG